MKTLLKILFFPITLIVWIFKNFENIGVALDFFVDFSER